MDETISLENYEEARRALADANTNPLAVVLSEKERRLGGVLTALKNEYQRSCGGSIPYHVPVLTDKALTASRLYRFCSLLPKGADLHVHDMAQLPLRELTALLTERREFCINTDQVHYDLIRVDEGQAVPEGYKRFCDAVADGTVTEDELRLHWTILGAEAHGMGVWDWFEELFEKHAALSNDTDFSLVYYDRTLRYYCQHGIMHMEIHMLLSDDLDACAACIESVREAYYRVKRDYPYLSVKVIGAGLKHDRDNLEITKKCFLNTLYAHENIKDCFDPAHPTDFVIGFDLINEEDASLPLRNFAPMLLRVKRKYPELHFYIHGGESLSAENDNLIDAYLLGVSRVGHGLNLYRYPDLLERYAKSEICLEVCPISNQTLGYTRDLRSHPAAEYLRRGVAVALCSDDPTYQENETLTDDFFAAALCWNLDLADLKQLAINSIQYSGLSQPEKTNLLKAFREKWTDFVDRALEEF